MLCSGHEGSLTLHICCCSDDAVQSVSESDEALGAAYSASDGQYPCPARSTLCSPTEQLQLHFVQATSFFSKSVWSFRCLQDSFCVLWWGEEVWTTEQACQATQHWKASWQLMYLSYWLLTVSVIWLVEPALSLLNYLSSFIVRLKLRPSVCCRSQSSRITWEAAGYLQWHEAEHSENAHLLDLPDEDANSTQCSPISGAKLEALHFSQYRIHILWLAGGRMVPWAEQEKLPLTFEAKGLEDQLVCTFIVLHFWPCN